MTAFSGSGDVATAFAEMAISRPLATFGRGESYLRGNGGGNMWPMIAGVGPLLGEGPLGYFIGPIGIENRGSHRMAPIVDDLPAGCVTTCAVMACAGNHVAR